jgi:hypothetical protein
MDSALSKPQLSCCISQPSHPHWGDRYYLPFLSLSLGRMSFISNTLSQESQEGSLLQALSATSPVVVVRFIQGKLATALPTGYVNDLFFLGFCHFLPLS